MAITRSDSKKKYYAVVKTCQALHRQSRLARTLIKLERKKTRLFARGRSTAKISKAIDQVNYALSYERPEGKKGSKGMPAPFAPPHQNAPGSSFKSTHTQVWGTRAKRCGVTHGSWVSNTELAKALESKKSSETIVVNPEPAEAST